MAPSFVSRHLWSFAGEDLHAALDSFEDVIGDVEGRRARLPAA